MGGVSDGWTWRKWNSGVAECWGEVTSPTFQIKTDADLIFSFNIPEIFVSRTNAFLTVGSGEILYKKITELPSDIGVDRLKVVRILINPSVNYSDFQFGIYVHILGTWK